MPSGETSGGWRGPPVGAEGRGRRELREDTVPPGQCRHCPAHVPGNSLGEVPGDGGYGPCPSRGGPWLGILEPRAQVLAGTRAAGCPSLSLTCQLLPGLLVAGELQGSLAHMQRRRTGAGDHARLGLPLFLKGTLTHCGRCSDVSQAAAA